MHKFVVPSLSMFPEIIYNFLPYIVNMRSGVSVVMLTVISVFRFIKSCNLTGEKRLAEELCELVDLILRSFIVDDFLVFL